jgi:penicillin-binding protein 1A
LAAVPTFDRFARIVLVAGAGVALGLVLCVLPLKAFAAAGKSGHADDLGELGELAQRSVVLARDGSVLAVLHGEENRSPVSLDKVPDHVVQAVLDVEDDRFFQHGGVDLRGTVRALLTNVSEGSVRQGGSTITQQLVKNSLLTPEKTVGRKFKEALLAVRLENEMSKKEILERYLNTVYFGNSAYGVQAAAETYFGEDAEDLTPGQAAFLAGVIRNPVGYDPIKFPTASRKRRNVAVDRMVANGDLTRAQGAELKQEDVPRTLARPVAPPDDYFVEAVKQRLLKDRRLGETAQERYNAVFKGGLKITTTLDPRMQRIAEAKVDEILPAAITKGKFTAALVSVDPKSGAVRAMVGGQDFAESKVNLALGREGGGTGRQPGSSFKPFVLAAALEEGYSPYDTINGTSPCHIKQPKGLEPYEPENFEGEGGGVMSLTDATVHSVNCAYVKLGMIVGLDKVKDMANKLGIKEDLQELPSMALGAQEVSPLEMASAYGTFAADGIHHDARFIERVVDRDGDEIMDLREDKGERVISAQNARVETMVLRQVVERGTGVRAKLAKRQVAGKTGTSQEHQNAWFVGYTPQLATAVWMGAPVGNVSMNNVGGIKVTGGSYPARIWNAFMTGALAGTSPEAFPTPNAKLIPSGHYLKDDKVSTDGPPTSATVTSTKVPSSTVTTRVGPSPSTTFFDPSQMTFPRRPPPSNPPPSEPPSDYPDCWPIDCNADGSPRE